MVKNVLTTMLSAAGLLMSEGIEVLLPAESDLVGMALGVALGLAAWPVRRIASRLAARWQDGRDA